MSKRSDATLCVAQNGTKRNTLNFHILHSRCFRRAHHRSCAWFEDGSARLLLHPLRITTGTGIGGRLVCCSGRCSRRFGIGRKFVEHCGLRHARRLLQKQCRQNNQQTQRQHKKKRLGVCRVQKPSAAPVKLRISRHRGRRPRKRRCLK